MSKLDFLNYRIVLNEQTSSTTCFCGSGCWLEGVGWDRLDPTDLLYGRSPCARTKTEY